MLDLKEVISRILSARPSLTQAEAQELIRRTREEAGGLLTEEGAAYMVANELGINLSEEAKLKSEIMIKDLTTGLNDASVTGRVLAVQLVKIFTKANGSIGKVSRLVIADSTKALNVILWDKQADINVIPGQIVRVTHGYVRAGLNGKPELNLGSRGNLIVSPPDVDQKNYPEDKDFFKKIGDLTEEEIYVNIVGVVTRASPVMVFKRFDGGNGQIFRAILSDDTRSMRAVFWNDQVNVAEKLKLYQCIQITGAKIKKGLGEILELHIENNSTVKVLSNELSPKLPEIVRIKIDKIEPSMWDVRILAKVMHKGPLREFNRPNGKIGRVANLLLSDETGFIRLTLWDKKADEMDTISLGDTVLVDGAYSRRGSRGLEINLEPEGTIIVNPPISEAEHLPFLSANFVPISRLKQDSNIVSIEGHISEAPLFRNIQTKRGETVIVASFKIRDDTGEVKVFLWRELVEKVEGLTLGTNIRIFNAYVRTGVDKSIELSSGFPTTIEVLSGSIQANHYLN